MWFISASGGAKGRPAGACAPSVNPCAPAVPDGQAVVNAAPVYCISQYSFVHKQRPTFWRSRHEKAGFRKQIFRKFLGLHARTPFQEGLPHPAPRTTKVRVPGASTPVLGPRPSCSLRSYGAPLVLQHEQTPGATTPLISALQNYAERTICQWRIQEFVKGAIHLLLLPSTPSPPFLSPPSHPFLSP